MSDIPTLTYKKKILIHLKGYTSFRDNDIQPPEVTQEGIADGVDMSRTHVSRVLQGMKEQGLIHEDTKHVKDRTRKLKTYVLTEKGVKAAENIMNKLEEVTLDVVKEGVIRTMSLKDIGEEGEVGIIKLISSIESDNHILNLDRDLGYVKDLGDSPEVKRLYGRGDLLENIDDWLSGETPIMVLYGTRGMGSSSLARRFLDSVKDRHILWLKVQNKSKKEINKELDDFSEKIAAGYHGWLDSLKNKAVLIVFDDYYDVEDPLVDMFTEMMDNIELGDRIKLIFTMRKGTPVYERFYRKEHLEQGIVGELEVESLDGENAEKILGVELEKDALKRIMQMTKGSPLLLKMLKEGNIKGMESVSPLTRGQISLLMFLKNQTVDS